jgi:two-component system, OmpR family, sensor kinase
VSRSLQRQLSLTLSLAIVLAGLVAALASFVFAYSEAQEFQDETLRQIAALSSGSDAAPPDVINGTIVDSDAPILVIRLPRATRPAWLPPGLPPGFHTLSDGRERMRVYVRDLGRGGRVAVAQATEVRNDSAFDSALRTLAPLLVFVPLLVWVTARIVGRELTPVRLLAHTLDGQSAERLQPLPDGGVPLEIASFVHAINRLLARVNLLMGEQRRFIADAAHELRSPLTALSLQVQNLEAADSPERARERIAPLKAGIERARQLTEQLLTLARTQAGASTKEQVDLAGLARELIADCLPIAEQKAIDLGMEAAGPVRVRGSAEVLGLILKNALDNALRFTPPKGVVTLHLRLEGEDAVAEVIDSGPGIAASERARVFQPFYRPQGAGGGGAGLGLAIARDAAARLGGTVTLHDRPDGPGLVFRYRQPSAPRAPSPGNSLRGGSPLGAALRDGRASGAGGFPRPAARRWRQTPPWRRR